MNICGKSIPGKSDSQRKDPKVEECLVLLKRNSSEASVAGTRDLGRR